MSKTLARTIDAEEQLRLAQSEMRDLRETVVALREKLDDH